MSTRPKINLLTATHIVLDLETGGCKPGAVIFTFGASAFNLEAGAPFSHYYAMIDRADCKTRGLTYDGDTLEWWLNQSPAAQADALNFPTDADPRWSLPTALEDFDRWLSSVVTDPEQTLFWGNSPSFDLDILAHAYDLCARPVPWKYWQEADLRTMLRLPGAASVEFEPSETPHIAIDDACAEARALRKTLLGMKHDLETLELIGPTPEH